MNRFLAGFILGFVTCGIVTITIIVIAMPGRTIQLPVDSCASLNSSAAYERCVEVSK